MPTDPEETIAVVDPNDRFVRWALRSEIHREHLLHRSVQVLVVGTDGRALVQRRHPAKRTWPDTWDVSVAGHVDAADFDVPVETADDAAILRAVTRAAHRELAEELGVTGATLTPLGAWGPDALPGMYEITRAWIAHSDGPFTPEPAEIAEVRWVDRASWAALQADERTTPMAGLTLGALWR